MSGRRLVVGLVSVLLVLASGLTAACGLALPFAPVTTPTVDVDWPSSPDTTAVALPLMPYQPVSLDVSTTCAAARATGTSAGDLLATTPPGGDRRGLTLRSDGRVLRIASFGRELAGVVLPPGDCVVAVTSDARATSVTVDARRVATLHADVRPVVAGVFTAAPRTDGLHLHLVTDTRFQTTPSAVKWALGAGCLAGAVGVLLASAALGCTAGGGRRPGRRSRRRRRRRGPGIADVLVVAVLGAWAVVGPASVDDGYLASMIRSRATSGFLGNVHRWLDAPEAPFSWYAEVHAAWASLAPWPAPVWWLRIPGLLLGLITWLLLSRWVLPRSGPLGRRPAALWPAALALLVWWLPFGSTLRPEPWVATGGLAVWVLTERAIATRRLAPALGAVTVAAWTVAVTPSGLVALVPLLVAVPAAVRAASAVGPARSVVAAVAGVAMATTALVPMVADQSLAAVLESTRVRRVVGVGADWTEEYRRWSSLLTPGDMGGSLAFRAPVLVLLVAVAATAAHLLARRPGLARGPARRLVLAAALSLVALVPSPTKWPMHFGDLGGIGAAVLFLLLAAWSPAALRDRARDGYAVLGVLGGLVLAGVLVFSGFDNWAWVSDWGVPWNDRPPLVAGTPVADVGIVVGPVVLLAAAVVVATRRARHRPDLPTPLRATLAPGVWTSVLLVGVVALLLGSFVRVPFARAGSYSLGGADLASLTRPTCGLADRLAIEPDPAAGTLVPVPDPGDPPAAEGFEADRPPGPDAVTLTMAGTVLPGWTAVAGRARLRSEWFALTDDQRRGALPVVITVAGTTGARQTVRLEFTTSSHQPAGTVTPPTIDTATAPRDLRAPAPPGADLVRVVAADDGLGAQSAAALTSAGVGADTPLTVGRPRSPHLVRFDDAVPPGTPVLTDWSVALPFPCAPMPALTGGAAQVPGWRLTAPGLAGYGDLVVDPAFGGAFATARELVDQQRIPTYLDGDPLRDPVGLLRWVAPRPYAPATSRVSSISTPGTQSLGRATVPGLDP